MKRFWSLAALGLFFWLAVCQLLAESVRIPVCAIVLRDGDSQYNEQVAEGFKDMVERSSVKCRIVRIKAQESQTGIVKTLIREGTDGIVISPGNEYGLSQALQEAVNKGIVVVTLDNDMDADSQSLSIKPASPQETGADLVRAVYQALWPEGGGQWAVMAADSPFFGREDWIHSMKRTMENPLYQDLRLVDIVFTKDEYDSYAAKAKELIWSHPDLKVICVPARIGVKAAADVVIGYGLEESIKVTGIGYSEGMEEYMDPEKGAVCPVLYTWDPYRLGEATACACLGLSIDKVKLEEGAFFGDGKEDSWEIKKSGENGLWAALGSLSKVDFKYFSSRNTEK